MSNAPTGDRPAATPPAEAAVELAAEVKQGRSWRTPFLALGGTALIVAAAVVVVLGLAFAGYYIVQ